MLKHVLAAKWATLGVAIALARDPGCGGVDSSAGGVNAPCTRDRDCKDDLTCDKGVCTGPSKGDAGAVDSGAVDAAVDG